MHSVYWQSLLPASPNTYASVANTWRHFSDSFTVTIELQFCGFVNLPNALDVTIHETL